MKFRQIEQKDKEFFAKYSRAEDAAECMSVTKLPLEEHIKIGVDNSIESYVWVDEQDRPCALFGLMQTVSGNLCWLLTTVFIEEHKKSYMKEVCNFVKSWYNRYGDLLVTVDMRYKRAVRLIEWAGFKKAMEPITINGIDFGVYRFSGDK